MVLAPFKWIVALFFNWSNALFNDPGWAVVGMSVLLSLLLTPLYVWIERRKNADKAKGAPMQAEIDKIEAVYTGRERFYYTREIQRRYKYSPWTAMIPTLGLLVQIPFLLAAYHYLSELPIFNGAAFWYIKDLSKPDTIATVAGLPINLLAILMTVINLVSGWRYAESGKTKERVQYMAVAAIFLVLLYNCAASVVLYWTLSNALSFVRSEMFFREKGAVATGGFSTSALLLCMEKIAVYLLAVATMLAVDAAFLPDSPSVKWFFECSGLFNASAYIVLFLAAFISTVAVVQSEGGRRLPYGFNALACLSLGFAAVPFASDVLRCPVADAPVLSWLYGIGVPMSALFASVLLIVAWNAAFGRSSFAATPQPPPLCRRTILLLGCLSALSVSMQLFLCGPVGAFASCPEGAVEVSLSSLLMHGAICSIAMTLAVYALLRVLPGRHAESAALVLVWVAGMLMVYGNFISADYGVLFQGIYSKATNVIPNGQELVLEALMLAFVPLLYLWVNLAIKRNSRFVLCVLALVVASFLLRTTYAILRMPPIEKNEVAKYEKLFRFSKTGKNVVYLILDNIMGQRVGIILDSDSKLKQSFDGFTWYPNTISASTFTFPDVQAMWGGEEYFPYKIGTSRKLGEVFVEAWNSYRARIAAKGYRFATSNMVREFGCSVDGAERVFSEMGYERSGRREGGKSINLVSIRGNALIRAVPLVFRPLIYDAGRWNAAKVYNRLNSAFDFMDDLAWNSEVVDDERGAYVHIHSEASHFPHYTPAKSGELQCLGADVSFRWSLEKVSDWLSWMKQSGVYDNTRIVLCSDHGVSDSEGLQLDARYVKDTDKMRSAAGGACPFFAFLAVKDFAQHGELRVDTSTKTVSHGAYFALDEGRFYDSVNEITPSSVKNPYPPDWKDKYGFEILGSFRITGAAGDGNNWKKMDD